MFLPGLPRTIYYAASPDKRVSLRTEQALKAKVSPLAPARIPELVARWREILKQSPRDPWVLFACGTCVVVRARTGNHSATGGSSTSEARALALLKEFGPVEPGSKSADMEVIALPDGSGFVIGCHHPEIGNFVPAADSSGTLLSSAAAGMLGRAQRDQDARLLELVHVEASRTHD